jgi:ferric-dicitrate binding protein FerR (iron transport regulator)
VNRRLEQVVREAREDWGAHDVAAIDWEKIDKALFDRLDQTRREDRARFAPGRSRRSGLAAGVMVGIVAVLVVALGKAREDSTGSDSSGTRADADESAGVVVAVEGRVLVNRGLAAPGTRLRLGDLIDATGRLTIERPGKLILAVERNSIVKITHVRGPLVLALDRGGIEASVVPVASGEAFAVDVEYSRIAVHGTHLRVAREGPRAVVDLSEGVVSIGRAPRVGSILGTLVVAPAHAEFRVSDAQGTLTVSHDPTALRAPLSLASAPPSAEPQPFLPPQPRAEEKAETSAARPFVAAAGPVRGSPSKAAPAVPSEAETTAALTKAVRACMAERSPAENVTVVVETTLYLGLQDDGTVRSARFEPPVAPDINECATPAIFKARFAHGGSTNLGIVFLISPE